MTSDPLRDASFKQYLAAGGMAGTAVDTILFPLDTIKTRLQSATGFRQSGGFRGIYSGLASAVIGSAPTAALFFVTYENSKKILGTFGREPWAPLVHMTSASLGEMGACFIRVPCEIIKQRMQTRQQRSLSTALKHLIMTEGFSGLYKGYLSTLSREIPFSCIQFPFYEYFKILGANHKGSSLLPVEAALCGSVAGGIAAALTTPFDVVKTRIMLSSKLIDSHGMPMTQYRSTLNTFKNIYKKEGLRKLFSGIAPRVTWISLGGFIFFGVYEQVIHLLLKHSVLE